MNTKIILAFLIIISTTIFCPLLSNGQGTPTPNVNGMVNATLTAMASVPNSSIPTVPTALPPVPATGTISGKLSYPSDFIPPLRVVAFDAANTSIYYYVDTVLNQFEYTISDLPAGVYHVVSYKIGSTTLAGGYTQMVPCGLAYGCNDHTLINVTVTSGNTTTGINPGDWYANVSSFPPMPNP